MIGNNMRHLQKSLAQQSKFSMIAAGARGFSGGGAKKPPIDPKNTDFDLVVVGGLNASCLMKFLQKNDDAANLKMAIVTDGSKWVEPLNYFDACHSHKDKLTMMSSSLSALVESWSKVEALTSVTAMDPHANTLSLSNKKEFTYKSLVLAPGFDHGRHTIKGLEEMCNLPESEGVFAHTLDSPLTITGNFWHGSHHPHGDMICYSPAVPYKGEGSDFYALYYEHFLRQDQFIERSGQSAKIQYWTPNKQIYSFPYANEVALDECAKRGIEVHFGWEMTEVKQNEIGQKLAVFKNVDTGEVIEKDFGTACINPASKPHEFLANAPDMLDASGGVDVNRYTLQHRTHENVFAFGDCISGDTTRTQVAAMGQNSIVKNNVLRFLQGKDSNGVHDGYSSFQMHLGHTYSTGFSHNHDFEPCTMNHVVPHYGIFSKFNFYWMLNSTVKTAKSYSTMDKDHGPPGFRGMYAQEYDELEHNELLAARGLSPADVRHPNQQARIEGGEVAPAK